MKAILCSLCIILSLGLGYAQDIDAKLIGEHYNVINITVTRNNSYPTIFAVVTNIDTIKVNLKDFDSMVESIFSQCDLISTFNYLNGFKKVFGASQNTYSACNLFYSEFWNRFKEMERRDQRQLQTGESVYFEYINVTGIFLKSDESYVQSCRNSLGLPDEYMTMKFVIVPIAMVDYSNKKELYIDVM